MAKSDLVVAMSGASGAPYGLRLLEVLLGMGRTVHLTISPAAAEVFFRESGRTLKLDPFDAAELFADRQVENLHQLRYYHHRDFSAGMASGSSLSGGMVVCPCSMGTVAAIAHGISENLIHRAADVHLKERRKLILVPRETPLGLIQLRNMASCVEAGAVMLPAMPAFYTKPRTLEDMVDFIVGRILDHLGIEHTLSQRWGTEHERPKSGD